jgi:hypothetical protein
VQDTAGTVWSDGSSRLETHAHAALLTHQGWWRRPQMVTPGAAATIIFESSFVEA